MHASADCTINESLSWENFNMISCIEKIHILHKNSAFVLWFFLGYNLIIKCCTHL